MPMELLHRLALHAKEHPRHVAIRELSVTSEIGREIDYATLAASVAATARRIGEIVPPGGVVIISFPNQADCTIAFLAALQANRKGFLVNPSVTASELQAAAQRSNAAAILCEDTNEAAFTLELPRIDVEMSGAESAPLAPRVNADAAGLLLLSSGTTQDPKIVYRDAPSLDAVSRNCTDTIGMNANDRLLVVIPLCHSYGVEHGILAPTYAGATVCLSTGMTGRLLIDPEQVGDITLIPGVPSMFEMMAGLGKHALTKLRCAYSAGAPLPSAVFDACENKLNIRIGQLYGSSEVGSVLFNDPHREGHTPESVGKPMAGVIVKIVDPDTRSLQNPPPPGDEGEVAIHSPSMLSEYVGQSESPLRDGFFFTQDLGRLDKEGNLTITGRINLLIDVGAMKVNPFEVEAVLKEHDAVADCVVVAEPISETVNRVKAMVVPTDVRAPFADELRSFARTRLSPHKVPRIIEFVDALNRSPTGKLVRRENAK